MKRIVINLFGAPASGKSTCAAYIFSQLKMRGVNAELITEFAKDKVWEGNMEVFKPENQCYLFGEQFYKMNCCKGKVDVIVTDSPLPLNILYNKSKILGKDFDRVVMSCFNSFNNISYLLKSDHYQPYGRIQSHLGCKKLASALPEFLKSHNIKYTPIKGCKDEYDLIIKELGKVGIL